jgi:hypothetical protein
LALRQAATGESGIQKLLDDLKAGKTTAAKFRAEMDKIYGGMVAKKQLGLSEQWDKLKNKIADILGKVDFGPLERALERLFKWLDDPRVAAQLQEALESCVQAAAQLVDMVQKIVGPILDAITAANRLRDSMKISSIGPTKGLPGGGENPWVAGYGASAANDNGLAAGRSLVSGLVAGISAGHGAAASAAAGLGRSVYAALQAELDAHSPSRKAAYLGRMIGAGLAGGQEESSREVQTASARLVQLPEQTAAKAGGGGRGAVSVGDVTITISGVPGAAEAKDEIRRVVIDLLEGTAHESGAPVTEAA